MATLDGTWKIDYETPRGARLPATIVLFTEDGALLGTFNGKAISDVHVAGPSVRFRAPFNVGVEIECRATITADRIAGEVEGPLMTVAFEGGRI